MDQHTFNKTILREYDIRGIFKRDLNLIDALYLGKSFATLLKKNNFKNVVVGYDGRSSSIKIEKKLIEGLISKAISGIMITGSHNPPEYNGFKMLLKNKSIVGKDILDLAKISSKGKFSPNKKGKVKKISIANDHRK